MALISLIEENKLKGKIFTVGRVGWSDYDKRQRNSEADKKRWSREISTVDSVDKEIQMLLKKGGKGNFPL